MKKQKKCAVVQEDADNGDLDDEEDLEHEDESDANSGRATLLSQRPCNAERRTVQEAQLLLGDRATRKNAKDC